MNENIRNLLVFALGFVFFYGCIELGSFLGRRAKTHQPEAVGHATAVGGALLGLLALMLGFAFAMAMNRYDLRKAVLLEEATDIAIALERTQLLPERYRENAARLLREYVDSRVAYYHADEDPDSLKAAFDWTRRLQREMWSNAVAAARENPEEVTTGYFIESLNNVIADHLRRNMAMENYVPPLILRLLALVTAASLAVAGFSGGLSNVRMYVLHGVLVLLVSAILWTIVDLDRPRRGMIEVSEAAMLRLQSAIRAQDPDLGT